MVLVIDPSTLSPTDKTYNQIEMLLQRGFTQNKMLFTQLLLQIFNNPGKLTPEDVVKALGTDAVEVFTLLETVAGVVGQPISADFTYVKNPDKTVTLTKVAK